jgi:hypothetical protein
MTSCTNRIGILLICSILLLLGPGCTSTYIPTFDNDPQSAPEQEQVQSQPLPIDTSTSRVCVYRFTDPPNHHNVGYTAASSFYRGLESLEIFQEIVPELDVPGISLVHQLNRGREKGCNLIFNGNVRLYLDGTQYQESRVVIEANAYRVDTSENIWHATVTEADQPTLSKDYYLYKTEGKEPLPAMTLLEKINEQFMDMLKDATAER